MGSWRRMGAFLGLVPDDESDDGEYTYADGEYEGQYSPDYEPATSSYRSRGTSRDAAAGSAGGGYREPVVNGALAMQPQAQSEPRPSNESSAASRPLTVKLTGFAEARIIGERYREGASVILDMTDLSDGDARRVVDFAAGLAFARRGSIDKVTARVFMLLPPHSDLSAEDRRAYAGSFARR